MYKWHPVLRASRTCLIQETTPELYIYIYIYIYNSCVVSRIKKVLDARGPGCPAGMASF